MTAFDRRYDGSAPGFIFGGNTGVTAADLPRLRKQQNMLRNQYAQSGTPQNFWEGLNTLGKALAVRASDKRVAKATALHQARMAEALNKAGIDPSTVPPGQGAAILGKLIENKYINMPNAAAKRAAIAKQKQLDREAVAEQKGLDRAHGTSERLGSQGFKADQAQLSRRHAAQMLGLSAGNTATAKKEAFAHFAADFEARHGRPPNEQETAKFYGALPSQGQTINIGGGGGPRDLPSAMAKGFYLKRDAQGNVIRDKDGAPEFVKAKNSPADDRANKRQVVVNALEAKDAVTGAIDNITRLHDTATLPVTGLVGSTLGMVPGTSQYSVDKNLDVIKSNIGFGRLAQMRAESKTGGALGQVSNKELKLLVGAVAALDQGLPYSEMQKSLRTIERIFSDRHKMLSIMSLPDTDPGATAPVSAAPRPADPETQSAINQALKDLAG